LCFSYVFVMHAQYRNVFVYWQYIFALILVK
jgi:hypothetical protein